MCYNTNTISNKADCNNNSDNARKDHMINSYIRDEDLKEAWDINNPIIRPLHQSITRGWIETADSIRDTIRHGHTDQIRSAVRSFDSWLYENLEAVRDCQHEAVEEVYRSDLIMDAYLEWGVRNYPITDRITKHTLESLERLYNGDPDDMLWDAYSDKVAGIIDYQTQRNLKPVGSMTREEMLNHISTQADESLRKMLAAIEYRGRA